MMPNVRTNFATYDEEQDYSDAPITLETVSIFLSGLVGKAE